MYVSERVWVDFVGTLYIWCMRDELGEFNLNKTLSQNFNIWANIQKLVSSERIHNNCKLPVEFTIYVNACFGLDTDVRGQV